MKEGILNHRGIVLFLLLLLCFFFVGIHPAFDLLSGISNTLYCSQLFNFELFTLHQIYLKNQKIKNHL